MSAPTYTLYNGSNAAILPSLGTHTAKAVVMDPPAALGFMGLEWDSMSGREFLSNLLPVTTELARIVGPGGYVVSWAYPKTSHWTGVALELGGLIPVTKIVHMNAEARPPSPHLLAPGHEEWIVMRAPGPSLPLNLGLWQSASAGRHPRTIIVGNAYGKAVDGVVGARKSGAYSGRRGGDKASSRSSYGVFNGTEAGTDMARRDASSGGPSRFFVREDDLLALYAPRARHIHRELFPNGPTSEHPTKKAVRTMLPLVDLVSGPDSPPGYILDPFAGSGTTGAAALLLGLSFVGIEIDPIHVEEARVSLDWYAHSAEAMYVNEG